MENAKNRFKICCLYSAALAVACGPLAGCTESGKGDPGGPRQPDARKWLKRGLGKKPTMHRVPVRRRAATINEPVDDGKPKVGRVKPENQAPLVLSFKAASQTVMAGGTCPTVRH